MQPQNRSLIVGLAAPGLLWLATSVAPGQDMPPPRVPSQAPTYAALLLSNGKVVRGEIVEDAAAGVFRVRQSGGPLSFPKVKVDKAAGSVEELYEFRVSRLAVGDPDERIKLARWCLTEHLTAQAKEQLLAVQAMCPDDADVKRMLNNLAFNEEKPARLDPEVRRTSGEMPASLDPRVVKGVKKRFNALPEIFDLPGPVAVKRASEFTRYVQPVLLQSCARCHNEKYQGSFQLVEIKNRLDRDNPDIARSNLDATLRLVNPDDPQRSDLLSAGLVPHGPIKNAVFTGPNDKYYKVLETWVKSIRPSPDAAWAPLDGVTRTGYRSTDAAPGEGFAADRAGGSASSAPRVPGPSTLPPMELLSEGRASAPPPPSRRIVYKYDESADFSGYPDSAFQKPFAAGGVPPVQANTSRPAAKGAKDPLPPLPAASPNVTQVAPGTVTVKTTGDPNDLPGMGDPLYFSPPKVEAPAPPGIAAPPKKTKPKIDNALLEKMMKSRNGTP